LYDITITIDNLIVVPLDTSICQGMNIVVNGQIYATAGIFYDTLRHVQSGCDSIQFVVDLQVDSVYNDTIRPSICANETYTLPFGLVVNTAGTYPFANTSINGCDSLYTVVLTVDALLVLPVNESICFGDSMFLANAWQNTAGVYADTLVTAGLNCDTIRVTTLSINALPVVMANANFTSLCQGDILILTGSGANAYSWPNPITDNTGFVQPVGTVNYLVTGTDVNGCEDTASINVLVNPIYNITEPVVPICEDALPFTFHDGTVHNSSTNVTYVNNLITITGCDSIITQTLIVNKIGVFAAIPDTIKECDNFFIEIDMLAQNMGSYQWQLDDGTGFTNLSNTGIYSGTGSSQLIISPLDVSLKGNNYRIVMFDECAYGPYMDTTNLIITEPHDLVNSIDDIVRCLRDSSLVYVDYNGYNYRWNNGQSGPYLVVDGSGTYSVTFIENGTDCEMEDDFEVVINDCVENCVVLAPTGFSPDASNVNDVFNVMTSCEEGFSYFEFRIFNRWGEMVYFSTNPTDGWNGNYKGSKAEVGVYVYSLDYTKNGQSVKEKLSGQVILIR
jgi:gliding motility-associated-like protein